jgi:uncharacterized protein
MTRLRLEADGVSIGLELADCATTAALAAAAPFEARAQTWGEELYFSTPVSAKLEASAKQVVEPGTVCFWTQGDALALPWGRTPISVDDRPKLANPCSVLGRVSGDPRILSTIRSGSKVRVSLA